MRWYEHWQKPKKKVEINIDDNIEDDDPNIVEFLIWYIILSMVGYFVARDMLEIGRDSLNFYILISILSLILKIFNWNQ